MRVIVFVVWAGYLFRYLVVGYFAHLKVDVKVVNRLGKDTSPVDAVYSSEIVPPLEAQIVKTVFNQLLAIIEGSLN